MRSDFAKLKSEASCQSIRLIIIIFRRRIFLLLPKKVRSSSWEVAFACESPSLPPEHSQKKDLPLLLVRLGVDRLLSMSSTILSNAKKTCPHCPGKLRG